MKKNKIYSIILLITLLSIGSISVASAQDSRQRTASTIVADGLAQLPAQNNNTYNQVMKEIAGTGAEGIKMIADMMVPADKGKNATFEYAIAGVASYVTKAGNENLQEGVRNGLIAGLEKCTDNTNRAFLLAQLQVCANASTAPVFVKYLNDAYLRDFAIRALIATPGTDDVIINLMKEQKASKSALAYAAYKKQLKAETVEPILQSWLKDADVPTTAAIYNALSACGSTSSVKLLKAAAQKVNYISEPTGATDAYLQLLNTLVDQKQLKVVEKAAKDLMKTDKAYIRGAGLEMLLKADGSKAAPVVLTALKDANKEYRYAALEYATKYIGNNIYDYVAYKTPTLPEDAQADVISWLGNNHVSSQIGLITKDINSTNDNLASAAIRAAGVIGGQEALEALINQLKGKHAAEAYQALYSFKGNIGDGVVKALNSDKDTQIQALKLASTRHMYKASDKVFSMLQSSDDAIKNAAYEALPGVVKSGDFDKLCNLLESTESSHVGKVQDALKYAVRNETTDDQYKMISTRMEKSSNETLYYPLLAQAGNADAIAALMKGYNTTDKKDAAFNALLNVDNPQMIDILFKEAVKNPTASDDILNRYIYLIKNNAQFNNIRKYQFYRAALEINPSDKIQNTLVSLLGETRTLPALMFAGKYLDKQSTASAAASTVKDIIAKESEFLKGDAVKQLLKKAQDVFRNQKDADSGYAVDEITGYLAKITNPGYAQKLGAVSQATAKKSVKIGDNKYENFEMYLDWKTNDEACLNLRSMPQINLGGADGIALVHADKQAASNLANKAGEWNTLYVKLLNDRILVQCNGNTLAENAVVKNTPETKPINPTGIIELLCKKGTADVRDAYIQELPSTPVFVLSPEEKKAGYEVLFDGRSLQKWQGNTTDYVPVDGNIYVSAQYGGTGNLYTLKKYSDFIYRFEFCFVQEGVNNGIGIRTKLGVDAAYDGMEIQVLDHDAPIYKDLRPYQNHGAVYGVIVPKHVKFGALGTWNTEEIRAIGDHITVTVNGDVILDGNIREACQGHNVAPDGSNHNPYTVDHNNHPGLFNKDGFISFCGHGAGVKFRDIRILDLSKKTKK